MFQRVHKYLEKMVPEREPILREMELYARERDFPIVGPLVGRLLYQMTILTKARKILELGSGFGYSARRSGTPSALESYTATGEDRCVSRSL